MQPGRFYLSIHLKTCNDSSSDLLVFVNLSGTAVVLERLPSSKKNTHLLQQQLYRTPVGAGFYELIGCMILHFPAGKVTYAAGNKHTQTSWAACRWHDSLEPVVLSCLCQNTVTITALLRQYNYNLNKQYALKIHPEPWGQFWWRMFDESLH